jgi:hypothetical protein
MRLGACSLGHWDTGQRLGASVCLTKPHPGYWGVLGRDVFSRVSNTVSAAWGLWDTVSGSLLSTNSTVSPAGTLTCDNVSHMLVAFHCEGGVMFDWRVAFWMRRRCSSVPSVCLTALQPLWVKVSLLSCVVHVLLVHFIHLLNFTGVRGKFLYYRINLVAGAVQLVRSTLLHSLRSQYSIRRSCLLCHSFILLSPCMMLMVGIVKRLCAYTRNHAVVTGL